MSKETRIDILDSFRFLAIISVILYHYYSRWTIPAHTQNLYPYGNSYAGYFQYGYLGVEFFFMISGFVILYTLEKSGTYGGFLIKRFIRLFPPMLLCSIVTYLLVILLDKDNLFPVFHSSPHGFLPGLTFSNTKIWSDIFPDKNWAYIDGAYWSLHTEVTFYLISGLIYFSNRKNFISNWLVFSTIIIAANALHIHVFPNNVILTDFFNHFMLADYIIFFTVGILSYAYFFKKTLTKWNVILSIFLILYEYHHYTYNWSILLIISLSTLLFAIFAFKPSYLGFLKMKIFQRIGIISYTVYLFHQFAGVILINKISAIIKLEFLTPFIPLLVILLVLLFAEFSYRFYEKPVSAYLKKICHKYIQ